MDLKIYLYNFLQPAPVGIGYRNIFEDMYLELFFSDNDAYYDHSYYDVDTI